MESSPIFSFAKNLAFFSVVFSHIPWLKNPRLSACRAVAQRRQVVKSMLFWIALLLPLAKLIETKGSP
jgi:hypothetical protein